ncbi:MAG: Stp1/IreP family PP2C-type Ser/Thr phosphatase [Clostridiales bacterium]|nr:Stp1/IreP family PP2C-type Ser/Thr phosphatase [Clostridiales bacterium]
MRIHGLTDQGCVRTSNQDAFHYAPIDDRSGWAVVCDGMGGAAGGNVASSLAVQTVSDYMEVSFQDHVQDRSVKTVLQAALLSANNEVYERAEAEPQLRGMGTTCIAAVVLEDRLYLAHVGDSRAYLSGPDGIRQLTVDHTIVQQMLERGQLTPEQLKTHPNRNIITRALGVGTRVAVDYVEEPFPEGAVLLLCTDGLTNYVEADEIEKALKEAPDHACEMLTELAKKRGGADNITVVALRRTQ